MNLVGTNELMRVLDIGSYTTIKKLENKKVITPIKVGRVRKWNVQECIESVIENGKNHEKKAV